MTPAVTPVITRRLACTAALLFAAPLLHAAGPEPLHCTVPAPAAASLRPGVRFNLTLQCAIDPTWHIYALEEPEGGPTATEVALDAADPVDLLSVDQSTPRSAPDSFFHGRTTTFEGGATFTLHLKLPSKPLPKATSLHVLVRYQACSDKVCLAPRRTTVDVPLGPALR